jgi:hypothetical protein
MSPLATLKDYLREKEETFAYIFYVWFYLLCFVEYESIVVLIGFAIMSWVISSVW